MIVRNPGAELGVWTAEDGSAIECAPAVLEEIRRIAVEGLNSVGHGGLERGGVLYGVRAEGRIAVQSCAELACEHARGPGFLLSDNDRSALGGLLRNSTGLQAVGWYRAHTRSGLELDGHDRELFDRFFAEPGSLGLVVKPTWLGPAAGAWYLRGTGGTISDAPLEFGMEPVAQRREAQPKMPEPEPAVIAPREGAEPAASAQRKGAEPLFPACITVNGAQVRRGRRWRLTAAAAMVGVIAGAVFLLRPHAPERLALTAYAVAPGQVRIGWDHGSAAVAAATSGTMEIADGETLHTILLGAEQLRSSSVTYTQRTGQISVRLRVEGESGEADEAIEFIGPPAPVAPAMAPVSADARAEGAAESAGAVKRRDAAERAAVTKRVGAPEPATAPERRTNANRRVAADVGKRADRAGTRSTRELTLVYEVPAIPEAPKPVTAPLHLPADLPVLHPRPTPPPGVPELQAPAKPAPPGTPRYTGPRSGRIIWTGVLQKRGVVELEGGHASTGSVNGSLPGVPVSLRISPAEITRHGMVAYTIDSAAWRSKEEPSQATGWNQLEFQFEPARAAEVVVLEAPNLVNHFQRLVLRNDARTCSVIILDWKMRP